MEFEEFSFGSIRIDGMTYEHDVVIDGGKVHKRSKKASKQFGSAFGHTPLSIEEDMPWKCRRLVIGTGAYGHFASDEGGEARGCPPPNRIAHLPNSPSY
jgi:hypothetical protein